MTRPSVRDASRRGDGPGTARHATAAAALTVALTLGCGPTLQRTLPVAVRTHATVLSRGEPAVRMTAPTSYSGIWNAVGRTMSAECGGVIEENSTTGILVSDYTYSQPSFTDGTVAVQERRRVTVVLAPGTTEVDRVRMNAVVERRERHAGTSASEWVQVASTDPATEEPLRLRIRDAASGARMVPLASVTWAGEPEEAARAVARHMTRYEVAGSSDASVVQTDWRTTDEPMDSDRLVVRSRIRLLFDRVGPGATRISVTAEMQYRVERSGATTGSWVDLDPEPVVAHGWATVQESLVPVVEAAHDETAESFARAPSPVPDLPDPRSAWGRAGAPMPPGVARTTSGGSMEIAWLGEESALDLLGRALSAELQPSGRLDLMGEPLSYDVHEENVLTSALSVGDQTEITAGYLVVSGHVGTSNERMVVVHEAYTDNRRYEVPEFASFANVDQSARYYVAAVTTGRAVAVSFIGASSTFSMGAGVSYEGFRAGIESSLRRREVQCNVRGRGVTMPTLACDESHVPTSQEVIEARDNTSPVEPTVTRVVLRRIPTSVRPLTTPQSTTITRFTVDGSACADAFDDPPDLQISWSIDGGLADTRRCPDGRSFCDLAVVVPPGARRIAFTATDRDLMFDDPCGRVEYDASTWQARDVAAAPPGPIAGTDHVDRFTVSYRLLY